MNAEQQDDATSALLRTERAPAKVTLTLHMLGIRADGYHELEALTVAADGLADELAIRRRPSDAQDSVRLQMSGPMSQGILADETNLAARAWATASAALNLGGADISLLKNIPAGAGLGGGSADAGAVLRACASFADIGLHSVQEFAAALGSDIPFCVENGPVWMRGRGEILEPVPIEPGDPFIIVTVPEMCSTPAVYRAWDELDRAGQYGPEMDAPAWVAPHRSTLRNDLTGAAFVVTPALETWRADISAATNLTPLLLGSGSSFVVFPRPGTCDDTLDALNELAIVRPGLASYASRPLSSPAPWDH